MSSFEQSIKTLIELSRLYGSDPSYVLAGGGNTSVKISDELLLVKASGHALATITAEGFVQMDRSQLQELASRELDQDPLKREAQFKDAIYASRVEPEKGQRPSVEVVLHELIPFKYVVHTHSTVCNALTCCQGGKELAKAWFGDDLVWIPYVDPGFTLAKTLKDSIEWREAAVILMENHGLVIGGNTAEEIHDRTNLIVSKITSKLGANWQTQGLATPIQPDKALQNNMLERVGPMIRASLSDTDTLPVVCFDDSDIILSLLGSKDIDSLTSGPLCPDQIVYCGSFPLHLDFNFDDDDSVLADQVRVTVDDFKDQNNCPPKVVLVHGLGMFTAGQDAKSAGIVRDVYKDAVAVTSGANVLSCVQPLSDQHRVFIEDWEVEAYRKKVSAGNSNPGRAAGKIAVVTGAAQGFGFEIAESLAEQGAHVVLLDLNVEGVKHAAEKIASQTSTACAIGAEANVTSKASLQEAMRVVVRTYGGFDIFVSNAGVLKAESVKTQSEEDFDFVTNVNYKGFFLCTQVASPILARQHLIRPNYLTDIIQINSKSGLVGSNRNGAYAGSKFGGIGLVQSFALELIEDGIKVNAICPGNFFDGPLWSDPEKGLFVQYLRANKIPGANSVEDIKHAYEAKVPMKRGCRTEDVMHALLYLIDQPYETGQAVPVTGGQTMLK